ncbi:MAG TPA: hypothetical protein ENG92_01415 [Thiolapillus brandeum]|uniref:Uncharacterized protein n=1 Tax=Thiolapillus brandeum TaxID=1076588 RepID=A0A831KB57_9GAMM|nr:hypothetical protein [Thiolapillus brandeum]
MNKMIISLAAASLLMADILVQAEEAPFLGKTPLVLCEYMDDMGMPGSSKYREQGDGSWACNSTRKKLPQGEPAAASDLQYRVLGSVSEPRKQILELRMRSYRAPQGVLNVFSRYVDILLKKTLNSQLSEEMYKAIMAPHDGKWQLDGHVVQLSKLRSKGAVYDLRFTLEYLP